MVLPLTSITIGKERYYRERVENGVYTNISNLNTDLMRVSADIQRLYLLGTTVLLSSIMTGTNLNIPLEITLKSDLFNKNKKRKRVGRNKPTAHLLT